MQSPGGRLTQPGWVAMVPGLTPAHTWLIPGRPPVTNSPL
jgi:hypothetical protein